MFNGYNETPFSSSNDFDVGKEKKGENVSKWWYGSNSQHIRYQPPNRMSEFWTAQPNFVGMQKCNCSDCYSSVDNQSYHNNTSRHRPWLPKTFSVPSNNPNEFCKLPAYQWESNLPSKNVYDFKANIPNFNANETGGKYSYHRVSEPTQSGVITSSRNPDSGKKPKEEISNEMGFYDLYKSKQQMFCNPAWNLSKTINNSDFYDVSEKYQNADAYKYSSTSHPAELHTSKPPVIEPYTNVVPFLQNRVPLTGQQSFKGDLGHSTLETGFNDTQKTHEESNEFTENKHLKLYHCQMGKDINNVYPMHNMQGMEPGLKNTGMIQHYPYNLPCRNSYNTENQKLPIENLQPDEFYSRKNSAAMLTRNSCDLDSGKQWQINQLPENFSDGPSNNFRGYCGVFFPELCKDNKSLRPKKFEKGNSLGLRLNENDIRNENFRMHASNFNDSRPQSYFPCQNNSTTYRNYVRSDYPPQGYNVPSRHEHHPVTHEKFQYQYAPKNAQQPLQNYNASQIIYHGSNAPTFNPILQQPEGKNNQSQTKFFSYKDKQNNPSEDFRSPDDIKTDFLQTISNEDVNKGRNSKISPLRLLRKKKNMNQNDLEPVPASKNLSGVQNLDVRKFFSTWVEEEEESETPTQVLVLDCQNLDPEQTKFLYLYDNDGIVTLKSADSVKESEKQELDQELREKIFLTVEQEATENLNEEEMKKQCETYEQFEVSEPQLQLNYQETANSTTSIVQESKNSQTEVEPLKLSKNSKLSEKTDVLCSKKLETRKISDENGHLDKWTEKKFDFLKRSEESKAAEICRKKEEQKKIFEKRNSLQQMYESKATFNISQNKTPEKLSESSQSPNTNVHINSPSSSESPTLPTSEYRRNKFLNYTDQKVIISPKRSVEIDAGLTIDEKVSENENLCQHKENLESSINSSLPSDKIDFKPKLLSSDAITVEGENKEKISEINFENTDVKVENENFENKIKLSHNKKLKKSKKNNCECESEDKNDKVTVDQIKFSIQKSHDLKISFKVLNSAANKYEDSEEKVEENTNQMNSNESANSTELITLKLKSIQNGDLSESKRGFRRKKFKKDKKAPVVKIKKSTYFEEKDPLAIDADFENSLSVAEDSSFQGHENDFQVKETVDSAKIKLTFKRHKSSFETECKVNQGIDDLEASDLENRPRKKWKKMKRREKGPEFVKAEFNNAERVSSKNHEEFDSKTIKFEPEEDTQNFKILANEDKNELSFTDSLIHPVSPVKEYITSSGDVPHWEEKSVESFSHEILDKFEENLESTEDDFCVSFVDEIQETDFNDKNKSESIGEPSKNEYSSDISNNQSFEETRIQISETLPDSNNGESVCDENSVEKTPKDFLNLFAEERDSVANLCTKSEITEEKSTNETNESVEDKNIVSKAQEPLNLEENYEENNSDVKLYSEEIKAKSQSEEKDNSNEAFNFKNLEKVEKNIEDSEFVVEELEKKEESKFLKEVEVGENEVLISRTAEECSNIEGIVEEISNSGIFQSSSNLNSNEKGSCCDIESPASELSFTLQTCTLDHEELKNQYEKTSEVENNEIIRDSSEGTNEITNVDFLEKSYESKEQEENSSKSLDSSDYCPEKKKRMWLSCENLKEQDQPLEISRSFVSSFLTLNTVEDVNVCEADCSANEEQIVSSSDSTVKITPECSGEEVSVKSSSLSLSLDKTSECNTNNLKLNNECQYSEANKGIHKASPTCQPFSHIKMEELGEKEIIGDGLNDLQSFETETGKTENLALTSPQNGFLEKPYFEKQGNSHEVKIIRKGGVRRKPSFTNKIIKRRHSFTTKAEGCDDLGLFKVTRQKSCPPCLEFLNIPHLDIPVEKIPLPPGNPLPENIFDFKKYFLLKEKESMSNSKISEETKTPVTAIQEKPKKCLENWKNEKEVKIKSQGSKCAEKETKYTPQDNTKIKFSLPKPKSLKSIFSENEVDNLCSIEQKKLINSFREQKTITLEDSKSQASVNETFVKNETISHNTSLKLNSTEFSTEEEIKFENENLNRENCQNKLVNEDELQNNFATINEFNKNSSPKVQNDLELEIVEEIDQEETLVKDFVVDNFIENEFYKCEDIPTSEDLTNGEGEIEDQKVSDDDKFRNIMQNCLDNAKRFLNEGNLKLLSCSVENLLEFDCGETNLDENEISETSINHISRDVLLTSCIGDDMTFPEKFQPMDVTDDYVSFFASEGPHNLCPEILPVDNWPYLEEEVPSSPITKSSEETDLILTFEDIGNQNSFDEENITSVKEKTLLPDTKHLKGLRRKSMVAEVDSLDNTSKPKKERRKTIDCFTENFWSYQKHSSKVIQEIKNEFENFWQKNISLKYHTNFKHSTKKMEKMNKEKETINYKSSKWQPKVILFRISKAGLERKLEKFKLNNPSCDQVKRKKFSEEIKSKPILEKQKSLNSAQSSPDLKRKESKDSVQHLKDSSDKKSQNKFHESSSKYSVKSLEVKKSKKSRFRNLHSKERKESKSLHDAKDIGTYHKLLPDTSILVDTDKSFSESSFKPKKDVLDSEAKLTNSKEKRKKSEDKHFSEKRDSLVCSKNGSVKVEEKSVRKSEDSAKQYHNHHHSKKSKHKHRREHRERKDSFRSDHKRRDKSPEKLKKQSNSKSSNEGEDSGHEPLPEEPWVCQVCGFHDASERVSHIKSHPFHCQSCHLAFKTEAFFVNHLTEKHKDIRNQHHCLLCELSFDTEKEYLQHLETREHRHLESVEKNTINTLLTLLTGQPCPVLGVVDMKPEWLPNQAGTVHFYHQATPLSLALQYLKMHHNLPLYSNVPSSN